MSLTPSASLFGRPSPEGQVDLQGQKLLHDLVALARVLDSRLLTESEGLVVSSSAKLALVALCDAQPKGLSQRELADAIGRSPAAVTRIVDSLTEAGLVERRPDRFDRRLNLVVVTPQGEAIGLSVDRMMQATADAAFQGENATDLAELSRIAQRIARRLERNG